jgi:hypothetical protein
LLFFKSQNASYLLSLIKQNEVFMKAKINQSNSLANSELPRKALSEKEVIQRYPFSLAWLRRARWSGESPPYIKVGHKVFYPTEELDAWVLGHGLRTSTSEVSK